MDELSRMDWNLLPMLEVLLDERNVSRAARRLGMSQPAMSHALARLRRHFGDDLLVRQGNWYALTPLAEQMRPLVRDVVRAAGIVASSSAEFDPRASTRTFTIAASDYTQTVLAPRLVSQIRAEAPGIGIRLVTPFAEPFRTNEDILDGAHGWLAPREMLPGENSTGLLDDEWVCVVSAQHPGIGDELTLEDLDKYPWVAPTIRGQPLRLHLDGLAAHGIEPFVDVATESFCAVPFLVKGTDRIGVLQRSLAEQLAVAADIRVLDCPWSVQPLRLTLWWHRKWETDRGHIWFRNLAERWMRSVGDSRPSGG